MQKGQINTQTVTIMIIFLGRVLTRRSFQFNHDKWASTDSTRRSEIANRCPSTSEGDLSAHQLKGSCLANASTTRSEVRRETQQVDVWIRLPGLNLFLVLELESNTRDSVSD